MNQQTSEGIMIMSSYMPPLKLKEEYKRKQREKLLDKRKYPHRCTYGTCERVFKTKIALRSHTVLGHRPTKSSENHKFACEFESCGLTYKDKYGLLKHNKLAHPNEKMNCIECDKSFESKLSLDEHVASAHDKPLEKKFACESCDKKFYSRTDLRFHAKSHHKKVQ